MGRFLMDYASKICVKPICFSLYPIEIPMDSRDACLCMIGREDPGMMLKEIQTLFAELKEQMHGEISHNQQKFIEMQELYNVYDAEKI